MTAREIDYSSRAGWRRSVAQVCRETYQSVRDSMQLERESGMFKTYLVEVHADRDRLNNRELKEVLGDALKRATKDQVLKIHEREERFFFVEVGAVKLVIECERPRYWAIQTVEATRRSDPFVSKLLSKADGIDRLWLPTNLQLALLGDKELRRLSAGFARRPNQSPYSREEDDHERALAESEQPSSRLISISGRQSLDILHYLRKADEFASSLFRLDVRDVAEGEFVDEEDSRPVALSSVWHHGKITLRGTWEEGLAAVQANLIEAYSAGVAAVENRRLRTLDRQVFGGPIEIDLGSAPLSRGELATALFDPKGPFKLVPAWKEEFDENSARFDVADMHTGDTFVLTYRGDEAPHLDVALPENACGNVVPRLLTNLQQQLRPLAQCPEFERSAASEKLSP